MTSIRMPTSSRFWGAVCALVLFPVVRPVEAQQPPPPVVITATGGFLGYLDGQRAEPGETYGWTDAPKGGAFGSADWLARNRKPGDILLVTANNLPLDIQPGTLRAVVLSIGKPPAWLSPDAQARIAPDAVGVGIDDFLRGLKAGGAAQFYALLRDPQAAPFVVSNAIVRLHRKGMNGVSSGQYTLRIPRDTSVDWLTSMDVDCNRCANVDVQLRETTPDGGEQTMSVPTTADASYSHLTLDLPRPLRPDGRYQMTITGRDGSRPGTFGFRTHGALARVTAATDPHAPAHLRGLPIRVVSRPVAIATDSENAADACPARITADAPIVVVALADPTAKARLATSMWRWKGAGCPADTCEIDFLSALDAFDAVKAGVASGDPCDPPPTFAVLSGLNDAQMPELIAERPEIRWIVMDPDTRAMGTARGREGIINQSTPDTTQLWARPQWVGSSASIFSAQLTWRRRPSAPNRQSVWELTEPKVDTAIVEGRALDWTITPRPGRAPAIHYVSKGDAREIAGPLDAYPTFPGMLTPSLTQGRMWTDLTEMSAFVLDIMRARGHADVAIVPSEFIDGETLDWLKSEYDDHGPLNWLSRFVAARMFYREERVVVAEVPGSRIVDVINRIMDTERARNNDLFAAGLGTNDEVPRLTGSQRINGRAIAPEQFYRLAIPQSVAQENGLQADHVVVTSLLDEIDRRMRAASGAAPTTRGSLGEQLEERFAHRPRFYLNATPARFDFQDEVVREGNPGVFSKIPLEGRSAQALERWGFAGNAEMGIDYRSVAYRVLGEATFARQQIANLISYPTDEWTAGLRADWKVERAGVHRVFGGVFRQSWFSNHVNDAITPTRTVENFFDPKTGTTVSSATVAGPSVRPAVAKPLFDFFRGGVDLEPMSGKGFTLSGVALAYDFGRVQRDRDTVSISGGTPLTLDLVYERGLETLVNEAYRNDPQAFAANPTVTFGYAEHDQRRVQIDGTLAIRPGAAFLHDATWTTTGRYRRYFDHDDFFDFTAKRSMLVRSQIDWTLFTRVRIGPFIDYYRVDAKGASGPFEDRKLGIGVSMPLHLAIKPGFWLR